MAAKDTLDALAAVKQVAQQFKALAVVGDSVDRLAALVNHEDELKASIQQLIADKDALAKEIEDARAENADKVAAARAEHEQYTAEYAAHREKLRAGALAEEESATRRITEARRSVAGLDEAVKAEIDKANATVDQHRNAAAAEIAKLESDHAAQRAQITAQTDALRAQLDELKGKVAAVLA